MKARWEVKTMIKRKTIKMIVLVLLMCMSCLIGVLLFQTPSTTASADTTPKYRVLFSYTNNQVTSNLGNNSTKVYRSGSNATSASVKDNDGTNMTFSITSEDGSDYFEGSQLYNIYIDEFSIRKPHVISLVPQVSDTETEWRSPIVHYTGMFLADDGKLSTLNIAVGYDDNGIINNYPYEGAGNPNDYDDWIRPEHITPNIRIESYE